MLHFKKIVRKHDQSFEPFYKNGTKNTQFEIDKCWMIQVLCCLSMGYFHFHGGGGSFVMSYK
jgi:hypothetical protein